MMRTDIVTEEFVVGGTTVPSTKNVDVVIVNNSGVGGSSLRN
jgi:hypothetical protein